MEKEINFEFDGLEINFFFEDFNFKESELKLFEKSLQRLGPSLIKFCNNYQYLSDKNMVLNISICNDETIQEMNRDHRKKNKITDVLSFPLQEDVRKGDYDKFLPEIELGDLYICYSVCQAQALEFKISFEEEFLHLSVHGFLHVLGFDHEISDEEERIMEKFEEEILLDVRSR